MPRHPSRGRRVSDRTASTYARPPRATRSWAARTPSPGLDTQLLDADVLGGVHPLLVRQEFVVESDEAVQGGEHEDAGGTGDPLGGSPAHEVIRAGVEAAGGGGAVHCEFGGRVGHDDDHAPCWLVAEGRRHGFLPELERGVRRGRAAPRDEGRPPRGRTAWPAAPGTGGQVKVVRQPAPRGPGSRRLRRRPGAAGRRRRGSRPAGLPPARGARPRRRPPRGCGSA